MKNIAMNPAASHEDVRRLAESDPAAVARHPNCPPDLWRKLAKEHPMEALENPSRLLFSLEDPARYAWELLERENAEHWIVLLLPTLAEREQQLWAADCAERVLPLYEREYPDDRRPRTAIQVRRDFALGRADKAQWDAAQSAAQSAAWSAARSAAGSAAWAAAWSAARDAAQSAAGSAAGSARSAAWNAERIWQWRRLVQYL